MKSQSRIKPPEELCQCPCHLEGLVCHSCYAVACRMLEFEAELRRITTMKKDLIRDPSLATPSDRFMP